MRIDVSVKLLEQLLCLSEQVTISTVRMESPERIVFELKGEGVPEAAAGTAVVYTRPATEGDRVVDRVELVPLPSAIPSPQRTA